MMRLIICRHGKAHPATLAQPDAARDLLPRGRVQASWLGQTLESQGPRPSLIVCSPILRAAHTARIIHQHLGGQLINDPRLSTETTLLSVWELIAELDAATAMVVGHNPTLSTLVAEACRESSELRTGEAVVVRFNGPVRRGTGECEGRLRLSDPE